MDKDQFTKHIENLSYHASKSALAKLLAGENIVVHHDPTMPTAAFDVKNRVLKVPMWKNISDELYDFLLGHETSHALWTPATWTNDIERVAKKYNTKKGYIQSYFNIIEDARIDKLMKRKFPGLKRDYNIGYKELFDRDFFGIEKRKREENMEIKDYFFIDRVNIYFKAGTHIEVPFDDKEQAIVDDIATATTWKHVNDLVERAWELSQKEIEEWEEQQKQKQEGEGEGQGEGDGEGDESGPRRGGTIRIRRDGKREKLDGNSKGEQEGESQDGQSAQGQAEGEGQGQKGKGSEGSSEKSSGQGDEGEGEDEDDTEGLALTEFDHVVLEEDFDEDLGEEGDRDGKGKPSRRLATDIGGSGPGIGITQQEWDENMQKTIIHHDRIKIDYFSFPELGKDWEKWTQDVGAVRKYRQSQFGKMHNRSSTEYLKEGSASSALFLRQDEWYQQAKQSVSYMVQLFERYKSADEYLRTQHAKTGILNMNKLYGYKTTDDLFLRKEIHPTGKNHGFVFFLDWSGSMSGQIEGTVKQLALLCLFCRQLNIPFEVYSFHTSGYYNSYDKEDSRGLFQYKKGDFMFSENFTLKNIMSSRENPRDFISSMKMAMHPQTTNIDGLGGTPLNNTIIVAEGIVEEFLTRTKVQQLNIIFLTDGASECSRGVYGEKQENYNSNFGYRHKKASLVIDRATNQVMPHDIDETDALLRTLKSRLQHKFDKKDINLVGFFLQGNDSYYNRKILDTKTREEAEKSWKEFGFVKESNHDGYDEHYVLNPRFFAKDHTPKKMAEMKYSDVDQISNAATHMYNQKRSQRMLIDNYMKKLCDFG